MEHSTSTVSPKKGLSYALTSGVFASIAGTFGKFAMTRSETIWYCENICISPYVSLPGDDATAFCDRGALYFQGLAMIMMILMNALMWTTFVKALRFCHTSLEATVTNTAANFFCSAVVGRTFFGESVSLFWWIGTLLIIFGLGLMNFSSKGGRLGALFRRTKKHKHR